MMYYGDFTSKNDVQHYFKEPLGDNVVILVASYKVEYYSGDVYVLFYDKNTSSLYEVFAIHCSGRGLEGQWEPEKVSIELLREKVSRKSYQYLGLQDQIKEIIEELKNGIY